MLTYDRVRACVLVAVCTFATASAGYAQQSQSYHLIREAQTLLYQADYNPGPIDGTWGRRTEAALLAFLEAQDIEYDGELSENELSLLRQTPAGPNYRSRRFVSNGQPISQRTGPNGVTFFPSWELPQYLDPPPNDATQAYYFNKWLVQSNEPRYEVEPDGQPRTIEFSSGYSGYLEHQLRYNSILSYLFYDGSKVIYDATAPEDRFAPYTSINNDTLYRSNSVGKSLVSYMLGNAICEGYIEALDGDISDWPLMENTLYQNATLIDLLNMRARDQHVVSENEGFLSSGRWFNNFSIASFADQELQNTTPDSTQIYNYNGFVTNLLLNYVIYKTGEDWEDFLTRIIRDKIGFEDTFRLQGNPYTDADGPAWYSFFATRYDYMRFALALLEDWQNENCVGDYLRDIYENRVSMGHNYSDPQRMFDVAKSYGGQFLFDFDGMRDRTLFGMNGYGGQNILIDMDSGRIAITNAAHTNFDWRTLVYDAVRTGELPE